MNHSVRHLYRYRAALAAKKIVDLDEDFATLLCTVLRLLQAKVGKKLCKLFSLQKSHSQGAASLSVKCPIQSVTHGNIMLIVWNKLFRFGR